MRILFDQGTPVPLRRSLEGHVVATAYELGWSTVTNGELIRLAEKEGHELLMKPTPTFAISRTSRTAASRSLS